MNRFLGLILTIVCSLTIVFASTDLNVVKSVSQDNLNQGDTITITFDLGSNATQIVRNNLDVMLTIDTSGGMLLDSKLSNAKKAAKSFINNLNSNYDRVGLVGFAKEANVYSSLTNNFNNVKNKIDSLDAIGSTNTGEGIKKSNTELLKNNLNNIKVQILLSDGRPTRPHCGGVIPCQLDEDYALEQAQISKNNNIIIYTISLGGNADQEFMQNIANLTGGKHYHAPNSSDLQSIFDEIKEDVEDLTAYDITIIDVLPNGVDYVTGPSNCNYNSDNNTVTCFLDPITNNSTSVSFDILVKDYTLNYVNEYTEINYTINSEDKNIVFGEDQQPFVIVQNVAPIVNDIYIDMNYSELNPTIDINGLQSAFDYDSIFVKDYTNTSNGTLTKNGDIFTYEPTSGFNGNDSFTITVSDNDLETSANVYLNVTLVNKAPVLGNIDNQTIKRENTKEFTITATDVDSIDLNFEIDNSYDFITINKIGNKTAKIILAPNKNIVAKNYDLNVIVKDKYGASDSKTITITVENNNPILNSNTYTITQNETKDFNIIATDIDLNTLIFTIDANTTPNWITLLSDENIYDNYATIRLAPSTNVASGDYDLNIKVIDDYGAFDNKTITITVKKKSSGGGSGGSGSSNNNNPGECIPEIKYSAWSECINGKQTRTYEIINSCDNQVIELLEKPCFVYNNAKPVQKQKQKTFDEENIIEEIPEENNNEIKAPTGLFLLGNGVIPGLITLLLLLLGYAGYKIYNFKKKDLL